jgi:hypothetical protein
MPLCHLKGQTLFFAHVPKAGGSSVEDYLIRRFGPLSIREGKPGAPRQRDVIQSLSHLTAADLRGLLPPDLAGSFAVVRDPVERLASEYRFQSGRSRASRLGFSSWLRVMFRAAALDPRIYENHIRPQTDLVPEGAEIFHLEDGFGPMVAWLDRVTGSAAPEIEVGHFLKRRRQPVALLRQDVARIAEFYAADYDRFGYRRPDPAQSPPDPRAGLRELLAMPLARAVVWRHHRRWIGRDQAPKRSASVAK